MIIPSELAVDGKSLAGDLARGSSWIFKTEVFKAQRCSLTELENVGSFI